MRDPVLGGERLHLLLAAAAELGLQRARRVVDAGVEDAGVVAGLVRGELVLLLQQRELRPGRCRCSARAVARPRIPPPTTATS